MTPHQLVQRELFPEVVTIGEFGFRLPGLTQVMDFSTHTYEPGYTDLRLLSSCVWKVRGIPAADFGSQLWWYDWWSGCSRSATGPLVAMLLADLAQGYQTIGKPIEPSPELLALVRQHPSLPATRVLIELREQARLSERQANWEMLGQHLGTFFSYEALKRIQGAGGGSIGGVKNYFLPLSLAIQPQLSKHLKELRIATPEAQIDGAITTPAHGALSLEEFGLDVVDIPLPEPVQIKAPKPPNKPGLLDLEEEDE